VAEWKLKTTDEEVDAALERAQNAPELTRALTAEYKTDADVIVLHLDNGRRLIIPREDLQGLEGATPLQIAHIEIFGGLDVAWPDLDLDHYLPALTERKYGSEKWMQSLQHRTVAA
jgi:hypothetical protein